MAESKKPEKLVFALGQKVEGKEFSVGQPAGEIDAEGKVTVTAEGLTLGHVDARMRRRQIVRESVFLEAQKAQEEEDKKRKTEKAAAAAGAKAKKEAEKKAAAGTAARHTTAPHTTGGHK